MKIEYDLFNQATVIENITQDYLDSLKDFSIIYGTYVNDKCYVITNNYYDAFSKTDTLTQTLVTVSVDDEGNNIINQIKTRYLKPLLTNNTLVWTRWKLEDASAYNYMSNYFGESGSKVILRKWSEA